MCIVVAESTALCPQVTDIQVACVKALAAEPALKWVIPRWKLDGVRALLGRPESAGALVSAIKERHEAHPELIELALVIAGA